ncbi:MAG: cadherin-like beta sandwich domain-containing protein [Lachnospiraceae bacterium]|nr:cadherin-like beta sandwich domain-containing protein [Lachnospiraceae bacterium]
MRSKALKRGVIAIVTAFLSIGIIFGGQPAEILGAAAEGGQASSNARLKSLSLSTGTMSPEFSPEVTSYTITVGEDVEKINVTCSTDDINAQVVEAGGFKNLKPGSNNAIITVQAADGTKCTYNLTIIRGSAGSSTENEGTQNPDSQESPEDENPGTDAEGETEGEAEGTEPSTVSAAGNGDLIPVGGESIFAPFQVHSSYPAELLPEGFVAADYNYKGYTVQSAYFSAGDIRLLYLSAVDGGSADFRIYYEDTDTFMDFLQLKGTNGKFIMPVRYQAQIKIPDNYTGTFMPWGEKVISCFIYTELTDLPIKGPQDTDDGSEEETPQEEAEPVNVDELEEMPEFYLIFAMNNEGGENFYLYDYVEGTYQRYVERDTSYELDQSYFKYKDMAHQRFAIMCVLFVLLTIAAFCIVNLWMQNRELKKEVDDDEPEYETDTDRASVKKREASEKKEKTPKTEKPERKEKPVKSESDKKEKVPAAGEKPVKEKKAVKEAKPAKETKPVKETRPVKESKTAKAGKAADREVDTDSLEAKIIGQLEETEPVVKKAPVTTRKPSNFKMINLSREPGPTGLDDDFEFEFINFDDE